MKIAHAALYARDLDAMKHFYTTFFGAAVNGGYHNPATGLRTYFLTFEDGSRLEMTTRPGMEDIEKPLYRTGYTHLAFQPGGREAVNGLTARLRDAGYEVVSGPRVTGDGYYESCALDPEGNQIEIVAAEDMI